jgi:2-octaprenyl-6-methoxyphenol hydroxylase
VQLRLRSLIYTHVLLHFLSLIARLSVLHRRLAERASAALDTPMAQVDVDICITGAGAAGLAAALAVANRARPVTVLAQDTSRFAGTPSDTRTTAILGCGITFLENIGVWGELKPVSAPLTAIRIVDARGGWLSAPEVVFRAEELELQAFGYNVPNEPLRAALMTRARAHSRVTVVDTEAPTHDAAAVAVAVANERVTLNVAKNMSYSARLLIAADGRSSTARAAAGIATRTWNYRQVAIAASFGHRQAHGGISTELHRRSGPLTTVPLPDDADGPRSSLVWIETPDTAARLMTLDDTAFLAELHGHIGGFLGPLRTLGRRGTFPISGLMATSVAKGRVVLVGEAAHVVPPIGAQGLNLGFRDAAALADCIADADGGDPGSAPVLAAYARARAADLVSREIGIDLLNRSLLLDFLPVQALRGLGMHALSNSRTLRRAAMHLGLEAPGLRPQLMQPLAKAR